MSVIVFRDVGEPLWDKLSESEMTGWIIQLLRYLYLNCPANHL